MKILHILSSPRAEGTVKLALDWLAEPGHVQEVLVLRAEPPEMSAALAAAAAWYREAPGFPAGREKFGWLIATAWRTCRERQPDLVICWQNGFSPWLLGGAWLAGVTRLITHAGNPPVESAWGRTQTVLSTFVAWLTGGRMVCCSRYVASRYQQSPAAFTSVLRAVYNCAPVRRIRDAAGTARRARADRGPVLVMVATLEAHKDHATLLRALPAVAREIPGVELRLVGDGSLRGALEAQAQELGLDDHVRFLGSRRDVPALLGQSDVFVFSTTAQEGLGTVLIEALAAGLPIVASDVPACREALAGGKWGVLVPPGDPAALARALVEVWSRRTDTSAPATLDYLAQFSPSRMIDSYLAVVS